jgi:hypothetical protein
VLSSLVFVLDCVCVVLSCAVLYVDGFSSDCLVLSVLVLRLCCLGLSCVVLSCLVLSCLVLSCLVLSCLVLSCLVLSSDNRVEQPFRADNKIASSYTLGRKGGWGEVGQGMG